MDKQLNKIKLRINGMHCASCEVLIENKLKEIPGVKKVNASVSSGELEVFSLENIKIADLQEKLKSHGYTLSDLEEKNRSVGKNKFEDYFEIGTIFLVIIGLYLWFNGLRLIPDLGISEGMSYGFVFLIGLVAAVSSCMAVTGGLLLAVSVKYNELHPNLNSFQKFKPHLFFNVGRVVSYAVFGGLVGILGSAISLSSPVTGLVTVAASAVMLVLGLQMLKIFPALRRFQVKMPKFIAHKIHRASTNESKTAPFLLGGSTFFLPCGFTQALQLYVLSKGSFSVGFFTMLVFALGTMPALLSLSAVSSFAKGNFQRIFLRFSAVLVIIIGLVNVNRGLALVGINLPIGFNGDQEFTRSHNDSNIEIVNGVQIAKMRVVGYNYYPSQFTISQGIPVEWQIDATSAAGCAQVVMVPELGITQFLPKDTIKTISFTPQRNGTIYFNCPMNMMTPGAGFTIVPNTTGLKTSAEKSNGESPLKEIDVVDAQKFNMEITKENGFYPNSFTVKRGLPVEIIINDKVPLGGCMSVLIIPKYDIVLPLKLGQNKLIFTPTETGIIYATCSMGSKLIQFNVE